MTITPAMSLVIRPNQRVEDEIARLYDTQLTTASRCLRHADSNASAGVHDASRRIKKARALLFFGRESLGEHGLRANRLLRRAHRLLGPLIDADRVVETLASFDGHDALRVSAGAVAVLRGALVARAQTLHEQARLDRVREKVIGLIGAARRKAARGRCQPIDVRSIGRAVSTAHRRARQAGTRALAHPRVGTFHKWRRRLTTDWYMLRLISLRSGQRLRADEHRLALLDECLGRMHDLSVLMALVAGEGLLDRTETARVLRALGSAVRDQRHRARILSRGLHERPRDLAARVRFAWEQGPAGPALLSSESSWPQLA